MDEFDTVADLRAAAAPTSSRTAQTRGYHAVADAGGATYAWSTTSTATDDGGSVIKPTAVTGAGRWILLPVAEINLRWFGAKGDGKITTGSVSAASNVLTVPSGLITSADVGKLIRVRRAGSANLDSLYTTIQAVPTATTVQLAANAVAAVTGQEVVWGTDDTTTINSWIASMKAGGSRRGRIPLGRYLTTLFHDLYRIDGLHLVGEPGAIFDYPSDDLSIGNGSDPTFNYTHRRSCFLVRQSDDVTIENLTFWGGQGYKIGDGTGLGAHVGAGIYGSYSQNLRVVRCAQRYGATLLQQNNMEDAVLGYDRGLRVLACSAYGSRQAMNAGSDAVIEGYHLEQPDADPSYNRAGTVGSSHGIYIFAGRDNVVVRSCTFRNVRGDSVKISGSSAPIRGALIEGNTFIQETPRTSGGIVFGADDTNEHSACRIANNVFIDSAGVGILGSNTVIIEGNQFLKTADAPSATQAVAVTRYQTAGGVLGSPVKLVIIRGNQFQALNGVTRAWLVAIDATRVGHGSDSGGSVFIENNQIDAGNGGGISLGIEVEKCIGPVVRGNSINGVVTAVNLFGNRMPEVYGNVLHPNASTSSNAQIRTLRDTFPIIHGNKTSGRFATMPGWTVGAQGGSAGADYPLLGYVVRAIPAAGRWEAPIGYGDDWTNGDTLTIVVGGSTYTLTYTPSAPNTALGQFNSAATLISAINSVAAGVLTAADYGAPWTITTDHILVRSAAAGATQFDIRRSCANATAGVLLINDNYPALRCISQGGQVAPFNRTVIWSPVAQQYAAVQLIADNPDARTLLQAGGYHINATNRTTPAAGSFLIAEHGTIMGTEQFRVAIVD